ncbi:TetR/AcrR family transcriptional regulator [Rhodovibrionaceae bacterium A322]
MSDNERNDGHRQNSRREEVLTAAAQLFSRNGYDSTSMRDIASAVGMLPGSLYYHFPSKEELFVAIHDAGVEQIYNGVEKAIQEVDGPWEQLEAAASAHMQAILVEESFAAVMTQLYPSRLARVSGTLIDQRNRYEKMYRDIIGQLDLSDSDKRYLRLSLLGAMNWSLRWYKEGGDSPEDIGKHFVGLYRLKYS